MQTINQCYISRYGTLILYLLRWKNFFSNVQYPEKNYTKIVNKIVDSSDHIKLFGFLNLIALMIL